VLKTWKIFKRNLFTNITSREIAEQQQELLRVETNYHIYGRTLYGY